MMYITQYTSSSLRIMLYTLVYGLAVFVLKLGEDT